MKIKNYNGFLSAFTLILNYFKFGAAAPESTSSNLIQAPSFSNSLLEKHQGIISKLSSKHEPLSWYFDAPADITDAEFLVLDENQRNQRFEKLKSCVSELCEMDRRLLIQNKEIEDKIKSLEIVLKGSNTPDQRVIKVPEIVSAFLNEGSSTLWLKSLFKDIHSSIQNPEIMEIANKLAADVRELYAESSVDKKILRLVTDLVKASFFGETVDISKVNILIQYFKLILARTDLKKSAQNLYNNKIPCHLFIFLEENLEAREVLLKAALTFLDSRVPFAIHLAYLKSCSDVEDTIRKLIEQHRCCVSTLEDLQRLKEDLLLRKSSLEGKIKQYLQEEAMEY